MLVGPGRDGEIRIRGEAAAPGAQQFLGAVSETLREQGLPAPTVAGGMTYLQARTANEVLKAQERRIRLQKLKGEVVDRARASRWCSAWRGRNGTPGPAGRRGWRR